MTQESTDMLNRIIEQVNRKRGDKPYLSQHELLMQFGEFDLFEVRHQAFKASSLCSIFYTWLEQNISGEEGEAACVLIDEIKELTVRVDKALELLEGINAHGSCYKRDFENVSEAWSTASEMVSKIEQKPLDSAH